MDVELFAFLSLVSLDLPNMSYGATYLFFYLIFCQLEKKDKEIHLKAESISHITQILQKTKKELEIKVGSEMFSDAYPS